MRGDGSNTKTRRAFTEHVEKPYVSADEDAMTRDELKKYLLENKVFENLDRDTLQSYPGPTP